MRSCQPLCVSSQRTLPYTTSDPCRGHDEQRGGEMSFLGGVLRLYFRCPISGEYDYGRIDCLRILCPP